MVFDPVSMCFGKATYASGPAAANAMKRMSRRRNASKHNGLQPYRCKVCSAWHLGHPPTTSKKALRKLRDRMERRATA